MTPLHWIGDLVRSWLLAIPFPVVRLLFVLVPVTVLIWVLRLPAEATRPPEEPRRLSDNLKVWAALALLIQIVVYSVW